MRYIKSIEIINFQSHKDTKIIFNEGYNVICGPSDSGKSAIIRALKWVLYNEPKGTDFITQGENSCKVSVTFSDDTTIIRERAKNRNIYRLIDSKGEESIFEGFKNDIPKEILSAHGINKVYIDIDSPESINLASQLEGPFLLDKTGSIKAKAIGKLVGVHIIDEALKELNKDLVNLQGEVKRFSKDYDDINEDLKQYENLENIRKNIEITEINLKILNDKFNKLEKLKSIKNKLLAVENEINEAQDIIIKIGDLDNTISLVSEANSKIILKNKFNNANESLHQILNEINYQKNILDITKHTDSCSLKLIDAANALNRTNILKKLNIQFNSIEDEINKLKRIYEKLKIVDKAKESLESYNNKFDIYIKLNNIKSNLENVESSLKKGYVYISKFNNINEADSNISSIEIINEKLLKLNILKNELLNLNKDLNETNKEIKSSNEYIDNFIKEYTQYLKELGRCPVCLSPIEEHSIEKIINEL
ncbi:Rad50 zinc hook motif-containing protein [Caloramator quimbayensis]|uniref:Nuclease SbcCD subunit C n=1 Tax=Caloramator quimbayensis TaxID=1147123 RepID=A0A1T4XB14_9CLOT|nr:AAA family ATPase [Caloramator quimbayensis]SKA86746.1 Rad50 zinc hook motif-containing protein [Caloramator quimbayensis]